MAPTGPEEEEEVVEGVKCQEDARFQKQIQLCCCKMSKLCNTECLIYCDNHKTSAEIMSDGAGL